MDIWYPNIYHFRSIRGFSEKVDEIIPTPKSFISFGDRKKMQGLSLVTFTGRFNLNIDENSADISDLTGNYPIVLSQIVSESNFLLGLPPHEIMALSRTRHQTLGMIFCLYKKNFPGLVINEYTPYDPVRINRVKHDDFNLPDRIGFS